MLKGDALEPQSWLRCPLTCVGQDATANSNLTGAIMILHLIKASCSPTCDTHNNNSRTRELLHIINSFLDLPTVFTRIQETRKTRDLWSRRRFSHEDFLKCAWDI